MKRILPTVLFMAMTAVATAGPANHLQTGSVRLELSVNKPAYEIGEAVDITLSLTNQGTETASFQFPTGQMFDFFAVHAGQRVWQWSHGRVFTQAFTTLSLRPGESKVFREQWNQRDTQDHQVGSGEYEMVALFPAQGSRVPSPLDGLRVRFRIGAGAQVFKPEVTSRAVIVGGGRVGEVLLDGRPVLRIRAAAGGISAVERAAAVANRLQRFLEAGLKPEELTVSMSGTDAAIVWRGQLLITADAHHARLNRTSARALASQWRQSLVRALSPR